MTKQIYESPDGGKTVYARDFGKLRDHGYLPGAVVDKLRPIKMTIEEEQLRAQYPELNDLWQQYQTLLALLREGPRDDYL